MPSLQEQQASAIIGTIGTFLLLAAYGDMWDDALEKQEDLADRQFEIIKCYTDHWCSVTYPRIGQTMDKACALAIPPEKVELQKYSAIAQQNRVQAVWMLEDFRRCYGVTGDNACDFEIDFVECVAGANAAMAWGEFSRDRMQQRAKARASLAIGAQRNTTGATGQIFGLLNNVQGIYSSIAGIAAQGFNGALGSFGFYSGQLGGGL